MTQTRIRWDSTERHKVARAAHAFYKQGMDKLSAVRRAQEEVLPANRRRENLHLTTVNVWLDSLWASFGGSEFAENRVIPNLAGQQEEEAAPSVTLADFSTEQLWAELGRRIFERPSFEQLAQQAVHGALSKLIPGYSSPEPEDAPRASYEKPSVAAPVSESASAPSKPKVLIIGLTNAQIQEVKKRYGSRINFLFEPGNASENRCRSLAGNHDLTIRARWTNNISLKGIPNVLHLTGGMSTIFQALDDKYPNN